MKVSVDGQELFSLSPVQKKVICYYLSEDIFESDMRRRLQYILMHLYEQTFKILKEEWEPKLSLRVDSIPTNPDLLAELIFSQPDYKCRKTRDLEENQ